MLKCSRPIFVLAMDFRWEKRCPSFPAPELELLLLMTSMSTFGSNSSSGRHRGALPSSSSMLLSVIASATACSTAAGSSSGNFALGRSYDSSFPGDRCSARSAVATFFTPSEWRQACSAFLNLSSAVCSCARPLLRALAALVYSISQEGRMEEISPLFIAL